MSLKKIKNIVNEGYNYEDSAIIADVIKELESAQESITDNKVNKKIESSLSKLRKFLDGRE